MMDGDEPAGLQNERTVLAWRRTAMAVLVAGALLARQAGGAVGIVVLVASAAGAGGVDVNARRRYRQRRARLAAGRPVGAPADVAALTAMVLLLSGAALVAIVRA